MEDSLGSLDMGVVETESGIKSDFVLELYFLPDGDSSKSLFPSAGDDVLS